MRAVPWIAAHRRGRLADRSGVCARAAPTATDCRRPPWRAQGDAHPRFGWSHPQTYALPKSGSKLQGFQSNARMPQKRGGAGYANMNGLLDTDVDVLRDLIRQLDALVAALDLDEHVGTRGGELGADARHDTGDPQLLKEFGFVLHGLAEPLDLTADGADRAQRVIDDVDDPGAERCRRVLAQFIEARDRVAVRRMRGVAEQLDDATLHLLAHDVFPAAGFLMHEGPVEADDVGEEPLC